MTNTQKFCVHCAHHRHRAPENIKDDDHQCAAGPVLDLVTAKPRACDWARRDRGPCGPSGLLFQRLSQPLDGAGQPLAG